MATRQRKKWSELTPAYRKRLESAYRSGKYGQGYSSPGRAYAAGAPAQAARGQAKTSEAERTKARRKIAKAKAWAAKHSNRPVTDYDPPKGADTVKQGEYSDAYLKAMQELEKGWKEPAIREPIDWSVVQAWYLESEDKKLEEAFDKYLELG